MKCITHSHYTFSPFGQNNIIGWTILGKLMLNIVSQSDSIILNPFKTFKPYTYTVYIIIIIKEDKVCYVQN